MRPKGMKDDLESSQCVVDVDLRTVLYNIDVLLLIECVESFV